MQDTQVQSLGSEDPLEKEMATHSNILEWRIPWAEEPGSLHSLVQLSCSVVSDSLQLHKTQHTRSPCPSPTPGDHQNPCPSSR